jgi:uncharacterized membrane protein YphA (DoxX/SURF4 family)
MMDPAYVDSTLSIFVLRLTIALIFFVHGPAKLKGTMGGFMTFIGFAETAGAAALFLGWLVPLASLGLAIIMCGAIWKKVHTWHVPFAAMDKTGWEFDLLILAGCLVLMCHGGGLYALDTHGITW